MMVLQFIVETYNFEVDDDAMVTPVSLKENCHFIGSHGPRT